MKNAYEIRGEITAIFVKLKGIQYEALISTDQLQIAQSFPNTWYVRCFPKADHLYIQGETMDNWKRERWILHRLLMGNPVGLSIDHINHDTLNNTRDNLRIVTHAENQQNRKETQSNSSSGLRGVTWDKFNQCWVAYLKLNGKKRIFGTHSTKWAAEKAVKEARAKYMPFSQEAQ